MFVHVHLHLHVRACMCVCVHGGCKHRKAYPAVYIVNFFQLLIEKNQYSFMFYMFCVNKLSCVQWVLLTKPYLHCER